MSTTAPATAPEMFVHFTTETDAVAMLALGIIGLSRTICDAVYAVAVGGVFVAGTQLRGRTAMDGRTEPMVAILFTTPDVPDVTYVEEATWHRTTDLPVTDAEIITLDEAIALLDGSANLPD